MIVALTFSFILLIIICSLYVTLLYVKYLGYFVLNPCPEDVSFFENTVDPEQMASDEAI